jgi:organic anion transporter 5A
MSVECILVAAFTAYMVFYTQHVYQLTSSTASILVGGVIVPSAIIGAVLGGWLVKKFNMNIEGCSNMIMISSIVVTGLIVLIFLVRCEGKISDGIDLQAQDFNASFVCDSDCECAREYAPTCGVNKVSYLSPCFAGCKIKNDEVKKQKYFL